MKTTQFIYSVLKFHFHEILIDLILSQNNCKLRFKWHRFTIIVPSDICNDLREGAVERFSSSGLRSARQCGAFLGAGDSLGVVLTEDELRASSDSPSVRPVSSLELESGLLTNTALWGPFESCEGVRRRSRSDLSWHVLCLEEAVLEEVFCSEEWEDRDSILPMGVLSGLLLKASPMQGPETRHTRPSLKPA